MWYLIVSIPDLCTLTYLETLGYITRLLNALNGLAYFLIIGDTRGDNLMVGSIFRKLFTELGIRTKDAEYNLMGKMFNFATLVRIKALPRKLNIKRHSPIILYMYHQELHFFYPFSVPLHWSYHLQEWFFYHLKRSHALEFLSFPQGLTNALLKWYPKLYSQH